HSATKSYPSHPRLTFFFNDTATTEIYTLSLHDALPISGGAVTPSGSRLGKDQSPPRHHRLHPPTRRQDGRHHSRHREADVGDGRSEEHTSELQSRGHLVCRLLLEKKKNSNS